MTEKRKLVLKCLLFIGWILAACDTTLPVNRPPVLTIARDTSAVIGDTLRLHYWTVDPEGGPVSVIFSTDLSKDELAEGYWPKAGMIFSERYFWYAPVERDGAKRGFTLRANDAAGGETEVPFTVRVVAPPASTSPSLPTAPGGGENE